MFSCYWYVTGGYWTRDYVESSIGKTTRPQKVNIPLNKYRSSSKFSPTITIFESLCKYNASKSLLSTTQLKELMFFAFLFYVAIS